MIPALSGAAQASNLFKFTVPGNLTTLQDNPQSNGFSQIVQSKFSELIGQAHKTDAVSMQALAGQGNAASLVTSVAETGLMLQAAVSIRNEALASYQSIINMNL